MSNYRYSFIYLLSLLAVTSGCKEGEEAVDPPELKGIWGSTYFERSAATLSILDKEAGDWLRESYEPVSFIITPKDSTYTMLKFEGEEVYLMNVSPYFDSKPGLAYKFIIQGDTLVSDLFPPKYETDYYRIIDLNKDSFKLHHVMEGQSLENPGDSIWQNYDAEMTFKRLK